MLLQFCVSFMQVSSSSTSRYLRKRREVGLDSLNVFSRCDLLFLTLALDYLAKKTEEEEGGRLLGGARKLTAGGMEDSLWKGGNMAINHIYTACFNRKRPRHEQGVVNVLHQPTVKKKKSVILFPPIRQTRLEVEMIANSAFESLLSQTPFSPTLVKFN